MKLKNTLASALLAAVLAASASAQVSVGLGDLVLGFSKTSGTGNTSTLEVALGSINNFKAGGLYATGGEVNLTSLSPADLNSTFGSGPGSSGWKSSVTTWAVVGTNGFGGGSTLWGTQASTVEAPGSDQGAGVFQITSLYTGLNGKTATANSASSAVLSTIDANNWKLLSSGHFDYWLYPNVRNNSGIAIAGTSVSLNLYEFVEAADKTDLLGTFKLYHDGTFSYTSFAAIPEPSPYAGLLGVVTLGIVAIRRRRQAAVEA